MGNSFYKEYLIRKVIGINRILKKKVGEYKYLRSNSTKDSLSVCSHELESEYDLVFRCRSLSTHKLEDHITKYELTLKQITRAINELKAPQKTVDNSAKVLEFKK